MTMGEKLKQARLERHMTQRQVVGDCITRNMLSKIENGSAVPSMKTLEYLANALGLPPGYFLSDESLANARDDMGAACSAYQQGDWAGVIEHLGCLVPADYDREKYLMLANAHLHLAESAAHAEDLDSCRNHAELALQYNSQTLYHSDALEAAASLLLARSCADEFDALIERYTRARRALGLDRGYHLTMAKHYLDAEDLAAAEDELAALDAVTGNPEDLDGARLRGELSMRSSDYQQAAEQLRRVETLASLTGGSNEGMGPLYAMLEQCYREMEDYKEAYRYASKQLRNHT